MFTVGDVEAKSYWMDYWAKRSTGGSPIAQNIAAAKIGNCPVLAPTTTISKIRMMQVVVPGGGRR